MTTNEQIIAACGLDCSGCPIRTADSVEESAQQLVGWFKSQGWLGDAEGVSHLMERGPYCRACRGDREVHWSATCWILQCCVDDKGLDYCYQCVLFPCDRLSEWAVGSDNYTQALDRLRSLKSARLTGGNARGLSDSR